MTAAADLLVTNAEVHTLADPDETHGAVAVRDGRIVAVGSGYELDFLNGVETAVLDLDGRTVLPGFVDAHTHLPTITGRSLVHADLAGAADRAEALDRIRERAGEIGGGEWVLGFGYDESTWPAGERDYLRMNELDGVSRDRPVVAFREDMHVASLNGAAFDALREEMPDDDVLTAGGEPTGVVVEAAVDPVYEAVEPGVEELTELVEAAQARANALGVTTVHDMVRGTPAPEVYRRLDRDGDLTLRVRLNYWSDHYEAVREAGEVTNHGSERVRTGAIKTYTDGTFGGRTANVSEPYADVDADGDGHGNGERATGQWIVDPGELSRIAGRADAAGYQLSAHAIGDEAVDAVVERFADCEAPGDARHRVEHAELVDDATVDRMADLGLVASVQPNFLKWARPGGLYESRLGDRRTETNRFADLLEAGVPVAFGSDCMPLDPLFGVHQTVNAPAERQRLGVTEALRAYTLGGAYAGFDEDRLGTVEAGKRADLVALERSPWDHPGDIENIDVALTLLDGDVVYDGR